jgi:hypothetical protein
MVVTKEGRLIIRQAVAKKIAMNLSDFTSSRWINADVEGSCGSGLWGRLSRLRAKCYSSVLKTF